MVACYLSTFVLLLVFRYGIVRALPPIRRYLDAGPWGDALAYFLQIQYYRRHSGAEPDPRCLFRGKALHTPSWYHRFALTLCPDAALWSKPWLPNLFLYALGVICLLLLAATLPDARSIPGCALLGLLFLAQTDNSRFDDNTTHYLTVQPRMLGLVALSLHAALFAVFPSASVVLAGGTLALLIALNTSVFSRQVAYFVLPLAALLAWNPIPVVNLAAATVLSLILNREEFAQSFAAHWRYAGWYLRNFYTPRAGSGLAYLVRRTLAPPVKFLPRYLDSALALVLLALVQSRASDPFASRAVAMLGAALIVCAITSVRKLASLGECWRYISFSCWMLTPLALVHAVFALGISVWLAGLAASALLVCNLYGSLRAGARLTNPNAEIAQLLEQAFSGRAKPAVWWSAHYRYASTAVALGCGAATFEIQGTDLSESLMASLFVRYPFLRCDEQFFDVHRVTHLLISKLEWPTDLYGSLQRLTASYRVLAENGQFVILAREAA